MERIVLSSRPFLDLGLTFRPRRRAKGSGVAEATDAVRALFEAYARATDSTDPAFFATAYGETFMFAGPTSVQAVKRDDFLNIIPKRRAFFATVGLAATKVSRIDESPL